MSTSKHTSNSHQKLRSSPNKHHLNLKHLYLHGHSKSTRGTSEAQIRVSNAVDRAKQLTEQEIHNQQLIEEYVFSKLEHYAKKPRLWQLTHSAHIKQRLLDKSSHISHRYSLPDDFVRESINQLFNNVDRRVSQLRRLLHLSSRATLEPSAIFQKAKQTNNQWRSLQLQRAEQIFPDIDHEEFTDNELLQKYYAHIIETLTPKPDTANANCIVQLREQPFDLHQAYEEAESTGKAYLGQMLQSYHERSEPNLELINEMIQLGLENMKVRPTNEEFENAASFLAKTSVLYKTKQAYECGLRNMGDDFMLLRFGKIFGPGALPATAISNEQFVYLVHLFIKSVARLMLMIRTTADEPEEILSTLLTLTNNLFVADPNSSIIKVSDNEFFSPKSNVDQWTWLLEKWRDALRTFPLILTQVGSFARLLRTTIGIGITRLFNFAETMVNTNQPLDTTFLNKQIFHALQTGFYFGIAYAIVDCAQDESRNLDKIPLHHLAALNISKDPKEKLSTPVEMIDKWLVVMEQLLSGEEFDRTELPKTPLTPLLLETFDSLITLSKEINITHSAFNELSLLLRSQRLDKKTPEDFYNDEELFLGAMLKSHFTYTCTTFLGNIKSAREESERLWIMPFLGQLTDDCRDFYDDVTSNSVTSFTHYAAFVGRQEASDKHLLNPFYAFLYLCTDLYLTSYRDVQTGAFLGRRIARTLRAIELGAGQSALREFLHIFCQNNVPLHDYCWGYLRDQFSNVSDPEKSFFRGVNKASIRYARTNRKLETYVADHLRQIEDALKIHSFNQNSRTTSVSDRDEQLLISGMNYSVTAGGKRLRPLLMLMISDLYQVELKSILPLACGIEYLHTSSLIFDDLPAQDNSDLRRGRPTLHKAVINNDIPENLCEGRAQLVAVDLIAVSMSLINHNLVKNGFPPDRVNRVVSEISSSMHDLCIGQMMDLRAAHLGMDKESAQVDELDHIAWFKTGKALEVVLVTPAILAIASSVSDTPSIELTRIRELGRLMGILFQMRDDLLDVEGENIGKPAALDVKNNTMTYVSTLGVEGTRQRLKEFRRNTLALIDECWPTGAGTVKDVISYIVNRKN